MVSRAWPTPLSVKRALHNFGADAVTWRKLLGLTVAQVAERAGVSRGTVRRLEAGTGNVSLTNSMLIVRSLGMLEKFAEVLDPYATDLGRLRSEQKLPERVRPRKGPTDG